MNVWFNLSFPKLISNVVSPTDNIWLPGRQSLIPVHGCILLLCHYF